MIRRGFTIISGASLPLCVATAGLWIWSDCAKTAPGTTSRLMPDGYPLGHGIRILADDGEISLYNQSLPYRGGTIGIARAGSPSPWPREIGFDFVGIYFRHFTWLAAFPGGTYWTLTVSLAWPLILTAVPPLAWAGLRMRRAGRRKPGSCPACGYDLRASINRCPECGTPIALHSSATA